MTGPVCARRFTLRMIVVVGQSGRNRPCLRWPRLFLRGPSGRRRRCPSSAGRTGEGIPRRCPRRRGRSLRPRPAQAGSCASGAPSSPGCHRRRCPRSDSRDHSRTAEGRDCRGTKQRSRATGILLVEGAADVDECQKQCQRQCRTEARRPEEPQPALEHGTEKRQKGRRYQCRSVHVVISRGLCALSLTLT